MSGPEPATELDHWLRNRRAVNGSAPIPLRVSSVAIG